MICSVDDVADYLKVALCCASKAPPTSLLHWDLCEFIQRSAAFYRPETRITSLNFDASAPTEVQNTLPFTINIILVIKNLMSLSPNV